MGCRPTGGDGLLFGIKAHALGSMHMMVTEQRGLPATETVKGHRHWNRHIDAHHAHLNGAGELPGAAAIARENSAAVAKLMGVDEIDRRFFDNVKEFMPWKKVPFDPLIDFEGLRNKSVLEIGVGNGSHAELLARHAGEFTGIDLTNYAANSTTRRLQLRGLQGAKVMQMDAENLPFPDASFDFVWSWGVIHHSANTQKIIQQIHRVLKPGGTSVIMVYHRGWWTYYVIGALLALKAGKGLHQAVQLNTDGAIARYYSAADWRQAAAGLSVEWVKIFGSKAEIFPLPGGKLKTKIMNLFPNAITSFLTNQCQMGSLLVAKMRKAL